MTNTSEMYDPMQEFQNSVSGGDQPQPKNSQPVQVPEIDDYSDVCKMASMGETPSKFPISKFRGATTQIKRISFLFPDSNMVVYPHYEKGMGKQFYCFNGSCCETQRGEARPRFLSPILIYTSASIKGDLPKDQAGNLVLGEFEVSYIALTKEHNNSLGILNQGFPLNTLDIKVACSDDQMQKLQFLPAGPAAWRSDNTYAMKVATKYKEVKDYILKDYAKKLGKNKEECEVTYKKLREQQEQWNKNPGGSFQGGQVQQSVSPQQHPAAVQEICDIDSFLKS